VNKSLLKDEVVPDQGREVLEKIRLVLDQLNTTGISYCHWKSNYHIEYALSGKEDLDLLVDEEDFPGFVAILMGHGFKQADSISSKMQPGVFHFLGNDEATGSLINIHTFTRILTGDHFLKSWNFPFAKMLLSDTYLSDGIRLPAKSSEIIVFTIRYMIKYTTLIDCYTTMKSTAGIKEELEWLEDGGDIGASLATLQDFFPEISPDRFREALALLPEEGKILRKIRLGRVFGMCLKKYKRYSKPDQVFLTLIVLIRMAFNRLVRHEKHMRLQTGGKLIALVGPQATGKSTLAAAVRKWLGAELSISYIHAGKPPATVLTYLANKMIPVTKRIFSSYDTVEYDKAAESNDVGYDFPLMFVLRRVMLAYERKKLLGRVYRETRNGKICLSDRYPSDVVGAIDGATFSDEAISAQGSAIKRWLMKLERTLYDQICSPDMVLQLSVSVEEAVRRNLVRDKEGEQTTEYVERRHAMNRLPEFHRCPVASISTDKSIADTIIEVKQFIWRHL